MRVRPTKGQRGKWRMRARGVASRLGGIAICGALPHLMPIRRTSSTAAVDEARQPIHTSRSFPADRPVTRGAVSSMARGSGLHRLHTPASIE